MWVTFYLCFEVRLPEWKKTAEWRKKHIEIHKEFRTEEEGGGMHVQTLSFSDSHSNMWIRSCKLVGK